MGKTKAESLWSCFSNAKQMVTMVSLVIIICALDTTSHGMDSGEWLTVQMRVTAYCPCPKCCGSYSDGITASGHEISQGDRFVAADKIYPFGTEIIIPGYKNGQAVKVLDRGGVIRGNRLDVFFNSHQKALEWGIRYLNVRIRHK